MFMGLEIKLREALTERVGVLTLEGTLELLRVVRLKRLPVGSNALRNRFSTAGDSSDETRTFHSRPSTSVLFERFDDPM